MNNNSTPIVRFAPSPTGRLHIGNMRTALYNWLYAKNNKGTFVLRLDDTDVERSTREFADAIVEDLAWLGIVPDRIEKQSNRFAIYDLAAARLKDTGLLYPCYESGDEIDRRRKRLMARGLPPIYDRASLKLNGQQKQEMEGKGSKPHWRFLLPNFESNPFEPRRTEIHFEDTMRGHQTVDLGSMSDPVLIREDGSYLYTLPSVVDDIDFGVTDVIRGGDHITNSGAQIAIFKALDGPVPCFGHHNLLQDASGEGLSKRTGALSIASLRESGLEPMAVSSLATLTGTGQPVEVCSNMGELGGLFDPTKVSKSNARFDVEELEGLNEKILHAMEYETVKARLGDLHADLGPVFWSAVRANLNRFDEAKSWAKIVEGDFQKVQFNAQDLSFLQQAKDLLPAAPWRDDIWSRWTGAVKKQTGRKGRSLFMPLRLALTGRDSGPELAALLPVIGREGTIRRLP